MNNNFKNSDGGGRTKSTTFTKTSDFNPNTE
ncbi:hypothetical protein lwe1942 [Listeria welshimeri serovar 6b str. SLCC5334]|uniref:Uncharacterized protein n=1 Tax=Listeria welshimeri serovar 6b (strain ATCC 35897 / DSM 20650 / CCUG 15529 / CIP 8149 / NCTC 11857 / SLCC 5334 / V8) TaxID=386043 RepID=A0AK28_LISW6|nr:hypothetical protein lwe1942 [Listeria welshimeri serovar 6b str. SLCC5334]